MHNEKRQQTIDARISHNKELVIEQLKKMPILESAAQKLDIGRSTIYRWMAEDKEFAQAAKVAMEEGTLLVNDMAEAAVMNGVRNGQFNYVSLWLRSNHPRYGNKLRITTESEEDEQLSDDQEAVFRKAMQIGSFLPKEDDPHE